MKYHIVTYGCQMNYSDTERLKSVLEALGFDFGSKKDADLVIFNSCSVRQKAEDRVYGDMRNIRRERPDLLIGLTGCMVKSGKEEKIVNKMKNLDIAFRPEDMGDLGEKIQSLRPKWDLLVDEGSLGKYFEIHPKVENKFQVFVPIQTGCNKFCTYCIVPYARGREKCRPFDEVIKECKKLIDAGAKEITLIGQTVDSYKDGDKNFSDLLREIDKIEGLNRLRFTSPHPSDFSQELIETIAELKTTCPYIHLPIQSGSNPCLRRMNRPYTREQYIDIIDRIRKEMPDCAISTDIIVGFCGETEEEYEESYSLFEELGFEMVYISRYSTRKGTFADKKLEDDVPYKEKANRWHKFNDLLKKNSLKANKKYIGRELEVLVEREGMGRSREYKEVHFTGDAKVGEIVRVKITDAKEWLLKGELF